MARMSKTEQAARRLCQSIVDRNEAGDAYGFTVEWIKSKTWGNNPVIRFGDDRCCSVSGCGYCKHSTALAETLQFLGRDDEERNKIAALGGTGVNNFMAKMHELGWLMRFVSSTKTTDTYTIERIR